MTLNFLCIQTWSIRHWKDFYVNFPSRSQVQFKQCILFLTLRGVGRRLRGGRVELHRVPLLRGVERVAPRRFGRDRGLGLLLERHHVHLRGAAATAAGGEGGLGRCEVGEASSWREKERET